MFETDSDNLYGEHFEDLLSVEKEVYFIDCDPEAFRVILNYLRMEVYAPKGVSSKLIRRTAKYLYVKLPAKKKRRKDSTVNKEVAKTDQLHSQIECMCSEIKKINAKLQVYTVCSGFANIKKGVGGVDLSK